MSQFFYSREKEVGKNEDGTPKVEVFTDSFNLDFVIRTYEHERGKILVLLDDGHEQSDYKQVPKGNGKAFEIKKERQFVQSEIYLNEVDTTRFRSLNQ
jgi:hypothetical protein